MEDSKCDMEIQKNLGETETLWSNEHFTEFNQKLQVFFENQHFCDVTLISADDKYTIMAHKLVLASVSRYFLAMFGGSLCESNENKVKLKDIDGHSLKLIINFIYSGLIDVSADTVEAVLEASHFIELNSLEKLCCTYIEKNLDASNCLGISFFALRLNCIELYHAAKLYAYENFFALIKGDEFLSLSFDMLCEIISKDNLHIKSEEDVFHGIMAWINFDKDNRKKYFDKLLSHIRFPFLPVTFVDTYIEPLCDSIESISTVIKAYKYNSIPELRPTLFSSEQMQKRNFENLVVAISGCKNYHGIVSVGLYKSGIQQRMCTISPPLAQRSLYRNSYSQIASLLLHCASLSENNLIVNFQSNESANYFLDLKTFTWTECSPPPISVNAIVSLNGTAYAFGDNSIFKLDESRKNWTSLSGYTLDIHLTSGLPRATYKNLVYFLTKDGFISYNPLDNVWKKLNICGTNDAVLGIHILRHLSSDYIIEITETTANAYNLKTSTCFSSKQISFDGACNRTALHGKKILIYGDKMIYAYDVFQNTMKTLPRLANIETIDILIGNNNSGLC